MSNGFFDAAVKKSGRGTDGKPGCGQDLTKHFHTAKTVIRIRAIAQRSAGIAADRWLNAAISCAPYGRRHTPVSSS